MNFELLDKDNLVQYLVFEKEVFDIISISHPKSQMFADPEIGYLFKEFQGLTIAFFVCKN